jgi:hypothetical protein
MVLASYRNKPTAHGSIQRYSCFYSNHLKERSLTMVCKICACEIKSWEKRVAILYPGFLYPFCYHFDCYY